MKRLAVLTLAIAILLLGYLILPKPDPSNSPPKTISLHIGQTIADLARANDIPLGPGRRHDVTIDADGTGDVVPITYDDHWVAVRYDDAELGFELPAGRTLMIDQQAGRIVSFTVNLFAHALTVDELNERLRPVLAAFSDRGWTPRTPTIFPISLANFDERRSRHIIAQMKPPRDQFPRLEISVSRLDRIPRTESWILLPGRRAASEPARGYVVQVGVIERSPGYGPLVYPRRLFTAGDQNTALPLRAWIDDPDWTPEAAGMVPASQAERAIPDASFWRLPDAR